MADSPGQFSSAQAPGAAPWLVSGDPSAQGLSTTVQQGVTNQQVNGLAQDLTNQSNSLVTALQAVLTAINNQPSHA